MEKTNYAVIDAFTKCFSEFDFEGITLLLSDDFRETESERRIFLNYLKDFCDMNKSKGIQKMQAINGRCTGCQKGREGVLFINDESE